MKTVVYLSDANPDIVQNRLDEITDRIPCIAKYFRTTQEITITCRVEDAAFVERKLADLV